jgi:hypothetical protein
MKFTTRNVEKIWVNKLHPNPNQPQHYCALQPNPRSIRRSLNPSRDESFQRVVHDEPKVAASVRDLLPNMVFRGCGTKIRSVSARC